MATADDVIVEFEARVGKYEADLKRAARTFDQTTGSQQARMQQFERQMRASSAQISGSFRNLAGVFASAFSVQQLVRLADSFTRLQNNLKVAGLEGDGLARVQASLLDISQRYGTELEGMTAVFLKASLAQKELGASTSQIIQLNEIVAASLKITGTSAAQAQGALLQLGQALGSGVVRAEEFNSILEGALPLAQAAARGIDGMGGSVAKLRAAVADGNITSKQFFEGVLKGGVQTLADAEKATLTLAGGVTALTSALTVYFGEADKANGVSAALGTALGKLAGNLDTIIPALATIATLIGVRYVGSLAAATFGTLAKSAADVRATQTALALVAAQARANALMLGASAAANIAAASVTRLSVAGGLAARAFGGLVALLGGPVGVALIALAGGLYLVHQSTSELDQATGRYKAGLEASNTITDKARELAEKLATARGKERDATLEALRIEKARAQQALISAKNDIIAARATLARAEAQRQEQSQRQGLARGIGGMGMDGGGMSTAIVGIPARRAAANVAAAEQAAKNIEAGLSQIDAIIAGASGGVAVPGKKKKSKAAKSGPDAPTVDEIAKRFQDELAGYAQQSLSAMQVVARGAEERAELELRSVEWARLRTLKGIEFEKTELEEKYKAVLASKEATAAERENARQGLKLAKVYEAELKVAVERLAQDERDAVNFELRRQLEQEAQDLAEERYRAAEDQLRLQYDLADTEAERRKLALKILAAEDEYLRSKLKAVIASETAAEAEKERARIALASLEATAGARKAGVERQNQGAIGRYADSMADPAARVEEAVARKLEAVNQGITDALADALGTEDQFVKDLFSIFLDEVIFRPLAESLRDAQLGNAIGSIIGSIFGGGKAIGGPVKAGKAYKVGESGEEMFVPQQNGVIVPNHRLKGGSSGGSTQIIQVDARGAVMNDQFATMILQQAKGYAADAGARSYQQSMKDAPGAMQRAQRYGK